MLLGWDRADNKILLQWFKPPAWCKASKEPAVNPTQTALSNLFKGFSP